MDRLKAAAPRRVPVAITLKRWGTIVSDNTTGQPGHNGGQDDASRYPAGQQWQQPTSADQPYGQQPSSHQPYGQQPSSHQPYGQQPSSDQPYGQAPVGYGQGSPYGTPGGYGGGYGQPAENPGKTLGIVGLICAIIWPISIVGLIISIIAMVKSRKAGMGNGFALAGIIIGAIGVITGIIAIVGLIALIPFSQEVVEFCQTAGPGVQEFQGQEIDCSQLVP